MVGTQCLSPFYAFLTALAAIFGIFWGLLRVAW